MAEGVNLTRRGRRALAAVCAAALFLAGCADDEGGGGGEGESGPIKLGFSSAFSGPISIFGTPARNSIQMAVDEQNEKGGLLGRQIELITYDDGSDVQKAQTNVRRLIDDDEVDMLFSPAGSGPVLATVGLASAANLVFMNYLAQSDDINYPNGLDEEPLHNVFSTGIPNSIEAQFLANAVPSVGTKIGLIGETTPYGQDGMDRFEDALTDGTVVGRESYDQGATNLTAQLLKLDEAGADVIVSFGVPTDQVTTVKNMETLGLEQPMAGTVGLGNSFFYEVAGDLADGVIFGNPTIFADPASYSPEAQAFADAYLAEYGNDDAYGKAENPQPSFGVTATRGYQAAQLYFQAVEEAGSLDTQEVIEAMESGTDFETVTGPVSFSSEDHYAFGAEDLGLYIIRVQPDGSVKIEPLE